MQLFCANLHPLHLYPSATDLTIYPYLVVATVSQNNSEQGAASPHPNMADNVPIQGKHLQSRLNLLCNEVQVRQLDRFQNLSWVSKRFDSVPSVPAVMNNVFYIDYVLCFLDLIRLFKINTHCCRLIWSLMLSFYYRDDIFFLMCCYHRRLCQTTNWRFVL